MTTEKHTNIVCMKAQKKLTVMMRKRKYLAFDKVRILFRTIFVNLKVVL